MSLLTSILRFRLRGGVQHLIVHVTDRCPLRCRTCFVRPEPGVEQIGPADLAPFVRALGRVGMVDLGGGEPFLRDDLPAFAALFPRASGFGIPTCGWDAGVIVPKVRDVLAVVPPKRLFIVLSLDGFEATNDSIRGAGTFARALETLRVLRAVPGLRVKVNTVLCRQNAGQLLDFMRFIRAERPWFHSILLVRGDPRDPDCALPSVDALEGLVPEIARIQNEYAEGPQFRRRIQQRYVRLLWDTSLRILREQRMPVPCLAGRAHLVIYANGDVAPCELLPPVGNIRRQSPAEILHSDALRAAVAAVRRGACHCTHNCNMVENLLFSPRTYPRLLGIPTSRRSRGPAGGTSYRLPACHSMLLSKERTPSRHQNAMNTSHTADPITSISRCSV